jgi:hypothetical protein
MFWWNQWKQGSTVINNIQPNKETIIERTISPDKVTEMYDKIKEEVYDNMLWCYIVKWNTMELVFFETYKDYNRVWSNIKYCVKINWEEIVWEIENVYWIISSSLSEKEIIEKILLDLSRKLAVQIYQMQDFKIIKLDRY